MINDRLQIVDSTVDPFGLRAFDFTHRIPEAAEIFPDEDALTYIRECDYPESADDLLLAWEIQRLFGENLKRMQILDAMCGPGRLGRELLQLGTKAVTFHDGHPLMVDHALEKVLPIVGDSQTVDSILAPVDRLARGEIFDLVICHNSTHQLGSIESLRDALQNMMSALKPGGHIVIADYQRNNTPEFLAALEERLQNTKPNVIPLLIPTFLAAFTKQEFKRAIHVVGLSSLWIFDAAPPVLTPEMRERVDQDPVKGHVMDFSPISLRVIARKGVM